ncbi:hypothetical protein [Neisseria bacilliformis]|uniref:hypothetical protein n=1 Tax=Neisseria bacilliformis TaxID=267212 RepID=UPI0028E5CED0|nr:hypothetical protein [Neisseria bacilliformis]
MDLPSPSKNRVRRNESRVPANPKPRAWLCRTPYFDGRGRLKIVFGDFQTASLFNLPSLYYSAANALINGSICCDCCGVSRICTRAMPLSCCASGVSHRVSKSLAVSKNAASRPLGRMQDAAAVVQGDFQFSGGEFGKAAVLHQRQHIFAQQQSRRVAAGLYRSAGKFKKFHCFNSLLFQVGRSGIDVRRFEI